VGVKPNHESYNSKKAWASIKCLILSDSGKAIMSIPLELRVEFGLCGGLVVVAGEGGVYLRTHKLTVYQLGFRY
jgi:hypothetical protein